ncbi:MAG: SDR family NAD(P)-dependent oxidoreductase [Pirellulales bacterium]
MAAHDQELTGLRAVVTGSSRGIGRAIALSLARGGADVVVHYHRSRPEVERVAAEIASLGRRAPIVQADLSRDDEARRLVDDAWQQLGGVEIWVNNAGADVLTGPAASGSFDEKLQRLLDVDVKSTILLSRMVGERMRTAGGGVILNMGWDRAQTGMEGDSGQLFSATKGAVMAFTKSLALEFAPEVRANCLAPGWIQTTWGRAASEKWHRRVVRETPLARWGTPEDVGAAARFLASPAAAFITGQVVHVNGGGVR